MKKIKRDRQETYPIVRLYKNDLDDIIGIFESNCKKVTLKADGYELDDASQLGNIKKREINEFSINGRIDDNSFMDFISFSLSKNVAMTHITDDSNTIYLGIASQIKAILKRRAKLLTFLNSLRTFIICGFFFFIFRCCVIFYT